MVKWVGALAISLLLISNADACRRHRRHHGGESDAQQGCVQQVSACESSIGYPIQGYPIQGYPQQGCSQQGYPQQGYSQQGYQLQMPGDTQTRTIQVVDTDGKVRIAVWNGSAYYLR